MVASCVYEFPLPTSDECLSVLGMISHECSFAPSVLAIYACDRCTLHSCPLPFPSA